MFSQPSLKGNPMQCGCYERVLDLLRETNIDQYEYLVPITFSNGDAPVCIASARSCAMNFNATAFYPFFRDPGSEERCSWQYSRENELQNVTNFMYFNAFGCFRGKQWQIKSCWPDIDNLYFHVWSAAMRELRGTIQYALLESNYKLNSNTQNDMGKRSMLLSKY